MPTSGGTEGTFIMVTENDNVFEDLFFNHLALGVHNKHNILLFRSWTHDNTVRRCWFKKATQFGIVIYGDLKEPGQGLTGNSLSCSDVGPEWYQCTTFTSSKSLNTDENQITIFPNPSEKR